jgi:hypothetical protein
MTSSVIASRYDGEILKSPGLQRQTGKLGIAKNHNLDEELATLQRSRISYILQMKREQLSENLIDD